nr:hypothetical protein [Tanacetum cinerariifolium]
MSHYQLKTYTYLDHLARVDSFIFSYRLHPNGPRFMYTPRMMVHASFILSPTIEVAITEEIYAPPHKRTRSPSPPPSPSPSSPSPPPPKDTLLPLKRYMLFQDYMDELPPKRFDAMKQQINKFYPNSKAARRDRDATLDALEFARGRITD